MVLLILAGVTINLLFSDTGLFEKAQEAENTWKNAENSDREAIGELSNQMNDIINGITNEENTEESEIPGGTEGLLEGAIIASEPTWDSSSHTASITLSKGPDVASNLSIEWQINKIDEENWTTGTNVTGLNHNDIVYARLTNGTNHGQEASVTIKDEIDPTTASLTVGTVGETSIAVTAQGTDNESGVYSYEFQRSTTSSTSGFTTVATQTSTATSLSYTYTGLTEGTTYYLRVVVTDKAGNTKTSSAVEQIAKNIATNVNELKEGDWVNYVDKNGDTRKSIVLYDSSSSYGVQIITDDTVETVTLGDDDDFTAAMNSYNNAISTLNTKAMAYLNTTCASDARCVGSVPNNKNSQSGYHTTQFTSSYSGKLRDGDTNYETDYNQMGTLGIRASDDYYFMASRIAVSGIGTTSTCNFNIRRVNTDGNLDYGLLCYVNSADRVSSNSHNYGLRPIFTLKSEIKVTGGSGTESSPYTLGV